MPQVLIDHARKHGALKRGGDRLKVTLSDTDGAAQINIIDLLELDDAMNKLRALDERKSRVVELLFFGGMTHTEAASLIGVSQKKRLKLTGTRLGNQLRKNDP